MMGLKVSCPTKKFPRIEKFALVNSDIHQRDRSENISSQLLQKWKLNINWGFL